MHQPNIEIACDLFLPEQAKEVLVQIFADYHKITIRREIKGGFHGQILVITPVKQDGTSELTTVVKLASADLIQKEWNAYQNFVAKKMANSVLMESQFALSHDEQWGGLRYSLAGSNIFEIETLNEHLHRVSIENAQTTFANLFDILEPWWQTDIRTLPTFRLQDTYNWLLPVNLVVRPSPLPPETQPHIFKPNKTPDLLPQKGAWVRLEGSIVRQVNNDSHTVLVNLAGTTNGLQTMYHISLEQVQTIEFFKLGQSLPPITGQVSANQNNLLEELAQETLPDLDLTSDTIILSDGTLLPNPLPRLPRVLSTLCQVKAAYVHGDLNLENVLINKENNSISIIDFGATRQDHIMHDLLRLESEVIIKLVAAAMQEAGLPLVTLIPFYERLHRAVQGDQVMAPRSLEKPFSTLVKVRQMANRHLFKEDGWEEYYQGLTIYLLGTLRFADLDTQTFIPSPKSVAFYAAAIAQSFVDSTDASLAVRDNLSKKQQQGLSAPFQDLMTEKTVNFVGREHVFKELSEFLATQSKGYFTIEGDPGEGKTAILAKYAQEINCIAYFNIRAQGFSHPAQFLENICQQLIQRYDLPYSVLPTNAVTDGNFLYQLLQEVSIKLKPDERVVIVVDALDEVELSDRNLSGVNILYLPAYLPDGTYFVLSRRRVNLPFVVANAPHKIFSLRDHHAQNLKDVESYIWLAVKRPKLRTWIDQSDLSTSDFVNTLARKSEDNFMYLRHVLPEIEHGIYQDLTIERLPSGLQGYYQDHWYRMKMNLQPLSEVKLKIIYILSEVRQPVSITLAADFANESPLVVQQVIDEWDQFLHKHFVDQQTRYSIYHSSFRDFLHRKDIIQAAGLTLQSINAQIADNLWAGLFDDEQT